MTELLEVVRRLPLPAAWLSYATLLISVVSLLISSRSLGISKASYQRGGPRVSARFWIRRWPHASSNMYAEGDVPNVHEEILVIMIALSNSGLAPVQVDHFTVSPAWRPWANTTVWFLSSLDDTELRDGDELPTLLQASASKTWSYQVKSIGVDRRKTDDLDRMLRRLRFSTLSVSLGNGQRVTKTGVVVDDLAEALVKRIDRFDARVEQWSARADRWFDQHVDWRRRK